MAEAEQITWTKQQEFINKWSVRKTDNQEIKNQELVDVNNYYDFYSGMTPYIEVSFREKNNDNEYVWNTLNSIDHPYFESLNIEDTGVKKATLVLFDKDFSSYKKGILCGFEVKDKQKLKKKIYSLDEIIKKSIVQPNYTSKKDTKTTVNILNADEEQLKENYLTFSDEENKISPGNLKIRFGYCDANQKIDKNKKNVTDYYKAKGVGGDRDYRWWNIKNGDTQQNISVKLNLAIKNAQITTSEQTLLTNRTELIKNTKAKTASNSVKNNSLDTTTQLSYEKEYMIIGYNSELTKNGIKYTINAIEMIYAEAMKKRFLQRYSEVVSHPVGVLYYLMKVFNETTDGVANNNGVKIVYLNDTNMSNSADTINMLFDKSNLSEDKLLEFEDLKDYYTSKKDGKTVPMDLLKTIEISFGCEEAVRNYKKRKDEPPLYKSVQTLIEEFCSACPPRKEYASSSSKAYDSNGNEIKNDDYTGIANMSWMVLKPNNDKDNNIYIMLYYKKARPVSKIRVYRWGPELPFQTVVKNLSIKNTNEFAILSGISVYENNGDGKLYKRLKYNLAGSTGKIQNPTTRSVVVEKENGKLEARVANYIAETQGDATDYDSAFSQSLFKGTMEILGDPGLEFNLELAPATYPIRIEAYVPNSYEFFADKDVKKAQENSKYGTNVFYGNQRLHELTGYYVITKITHNISTSGYTTKLEVMSYPNIEKEVLINKK